MRRILSSTALLASMSLAGTAGAAGGASAYTADFERLHTQHLTRLPHVARVHSSFALRTVQKSRELPVR